MRTVTGTFSSLDAAKTAVDALEVAGIAGENITIDSPDDGDTILSARVENEMVDAAHAIIGQSGSGSVEETDASFDADGGVIEDGDVEGEEAARIREPVPPVILPTPH